MREVKWMGSTVSSTSDVLAGKLSGRQKIRERFGQGRARVVASWGHLRQLLGDELDEIKGAEDPQLDLSKLEKSADLLSEGYKRYGGELAAARRQLAELEKTFQAETLRRRRRRTARLGLLMLLAFFMIAFGLRMLTV